MGIAYAKRGLVRIGRKDGKSAVLRPSLERWGRGRAKGRTGDVQQPGGAACGRGVVGLLGGRGHAPPRRHHTPRLGASHPPNGISCVPRTGGRDAPKDAPARVPLLVG